MQTQITTMTYIYILPATTSSTTTISIILTMLELQTLQTPGTSQRMQELISSAAPTSAATSGHIQTALASARPVQTAIVMEYVIHPTRSMAAISTTCRLHTMYLQFLHHMEVEAVEQAAA